MVDGQPPLAWWPRVSPRLRDLAAIGLAFVAGLAEGLARRHNSSLWWLVLLGGVLGAGSLWWRRSSPAAVTVAGMIVELATNVPVVLAVGLFTLAVRRRDRVLAVVAVAAALCLAQSTGALHRGNWVDVLTNGALPVGFILAAGAYLGARQDLLASLRERAERAEAERELRAEQARLAERQRIAREMHDVLAHKVSLIALHAGALELDPAAAPERVRATAEVIGATARAAAEDLRDVLGVLRAGQEQDDDARLAPQPDLVDIPRLVAASRAAGLAVDLRMEGPDPDVPATVGRTAYRVVQEGLTNVHKHAGHAAATVVLAVTDQGLCVEIVNRPPVGAAPLLAGAGAGLLGLRERVSLAGGTFTAGPSDDGGWTLRAWLPLTPGEWS